MDAASSGSGGEPPAAPAADSGGASADGGAAKKKRRSGPRSRSSPYTGVTQYKRTGNWEAHIWVQNPRGKGHQRHLGSYLTAEDAARCYDRAVLKLRGTEAETNFPREEYAEDEFLLAHERTERDRFLDLLRQRFALKSNAAQAASGAPTRTQPLRPKRKRSSPGHTANGSEEGYAPESPRYRTVVRAPRSSPMATPPMGAVSAAFPAGTPHRVTVHQWPGGGRSPALASPLPCQAPRHLDSPLGRASGGFAGGSGGGFGASGSYGNGGGGSGLLRHDSLGGASEDQLLITTTAPAATAQMRDAMLWPSLPISSAPTAGGSMPLPGPLSPLSSLPQGPSGLQPTPLMHFGQLSPAPPQLGGGWGGGLAGTLSPLRPLGVLGGLSLPGSRAATPQDSPSRFGSPAPAHLPAIPSFGDLAQLAPALQPTGNSGGREAGPAVTTPGAAVLGSLAGIQAQLSALETPGAPPALSGPSLCTHSGPMSGPLSGPMSTPMPAPASLQHFSLLSFPPMPLIGGGGGLQDRGGLPTFAFPSFGQGSGITSSMLQAASAAAAASAARAASTSQPAIFPAATAAGGSGSATPAVGASLASVIGGQGAASPGRWWQQASPACSEGLAQDWLAANLPMADMGAASAFLK